MDEWRTDFPPPQGFDGSEQGEWDEEGYWRGLTEDEHSALVSAGIAESGECEVTIEQDEAERDSFFAGLREQCGNRDDRIYLPSLSREGIEGWVRASASSKTLSHCRARFARYPPMTCTSIVWERCARRSSSLEGEGRRQPPLPPKAPSKEPILANRLFGARGLCIGSSHMTPKLAFALSFTASAALIAGAAIAADGRKLQTTLTGAAEVPGPGDADGTGTASITVNSGQNQVCFALSVTDIEPATAAHVHIGAVDVAGPVVVGLARPDQWHQLGLRQVPRNAWRRPSSRTRRLIM